MLAYLFHGVGTQKGCIGRFITNSVKPTLLDGIFPMFSNQSDKKSRAKFWKTEFSVCLCWFSHGKISHALNERNFACPFSSSLQKTTAMAELVEIPLLFVLLVVSLKHLLKIGLNKCPLLLLACP